MSTTKHLFLTERPGTNIEIVNADGRPAIIVTDNYKSTMAYFAPENGAKTALAILEAAGVEDLSTGGLITGARSAVVELKSHIAWEGRRAAEAKEQAKEQAESEAEALDLFNLWRAGFDHEGYAEWTGENAELKGVWLAVARKAREMAKESTK